MPAAGRAGRPDDALDRRHRRGDADPAAWRPASAVGADLALAHDIGQVRDVLRTAEPDGEPPIYSPIEDALGGAYHLFTR